MTDAVRLSPAARAQLDAFTRPRIGEIPIRVLPDLVGDQILLMTRELADAEARMLAAGLEPGPLEFESEQTATGWRVSATVTWRRR